MTDTYWNDLASDFDIAQLRMLFEQRVREFTPVMLPMPEAEAVALLDRLAADGLLQKEMREIDPPHPALSPAGGGEGWTLDETETVWVRSISQSRSVDWVIALHGMNTSGAWQESFSWLLGTTWGRAVPVAVYKYGIVIAGVILAWRRNKLREDLREKIAVLGAEARARGYHGNPDLIAHSFGTWLFGHLLKRELLLPPEQRLAFGRVILTGCVLRPDFDWKAMQDAGLVEDVLNHYGTSDCVVPLAHATIYGSGPSGRRGFDGDDVINIRAEGFGHSDLFLRDLRHSYETYWKPFLTLPREELRALPDVTHPAKRWRAWPWPLRGTLFPFVALPLLVALLGLGAGWLGHVIWKLLGWS